MSKRDSQLLLEDIIEPVRKIDRYRAGLSKSDFLIDDKTSDAVIRNLEIIGEAVRQSPPSSKTPIPESPGRRPRDCEIESCMTMQGWIWNWFGKSSRAPFQSY